MSTIKELERDAREELRDWLRGNPGDDPGRMISELADGAIPCYRWDVLELVQNDLTLLSPRDKAYRDPEKLIGDNIRDRIYAALADELAVWRSMSIEVYYRLLPSDEQDEIEERLYDVLDESYPDAGVDVSPDDDENADRVTVFVSSDTEEERIEKLVREALESKA